MKFYCGASAFSSLRAVLEIIWFRARCDCIRFEPECSGAAVPAEIVINSPRRAATRNSRLSRASLQEYEENINGPYESEFQRSDDVDEEFRYFLVWRCTLAQFILIWKRVDERCNRFTHCIASSIDALLVSPRCYIEFLLFRLPLYRLAGYTLDSFWLALLCRIEEEPSQSLYVLMLRRSLLFFFVCINTLLSFADGERKMFGEFLCLRYEAAANSARDIRGNNSEEQERQKTLQSWIFHSRLLFLLLFSSSLASSPSFTSK